MFRRDRHADLPDLLWSLFTGIVAGLFIGEITSSMLAGLGVLALSIAGAAFRMKKRHEQD